MAAVLEMSPEQFRVRSSSTDRVMECAGSIVPAEAPYSPNTDEAREGSAKHEALGFVVRGESLPVERIAEKWQVDADEIEKAVATGRIAWAELSKFFPQAKAEAKLYGVYTVGTSDVVSVVFGDDKTRPLTLAVLDWKSGRSHDEHGYQLMSYAQSARETFGFPLSGYITATEVWLAHKEQRTRNLTEAELDGFRDRLANQIRLAGKQFAPGPHCKFCPRQNNCQARDEYLRSVVSVLAPVGEGTAALSREDLGKLYDRSKLLERALRQYSAMLDEALMDGPIPLGNGKALKLMPEESDHIDAVPSERLLRADGWSDADMAKVLRATKGGIEKVIKGRVSRGFGASAIRKTHKMLREAGAMRKIESMTKTVVDVDPANKEITDG